MNGLHWIRVAREVNGKRECFWTFGEVDGEKVIPLNGAHEGLTVEAVGPYACAKGDLTAKPRAWRPPARNPKVAKTEEIYYGA